jgi:hypothetical protein
LQDILDAAYCKRSFLPVNTETTTHQDRQKGTGNMPVDPCGMIGRRRPLSELDSSHGRERSPMFHGEWSEKASKNPLTNASGV